MKTLFAVLLLLVAGCRDEKKAWFEKSATLITANGFTFEMYGNRTTGHAPDAHNPSGPTSVEIGAALEVEAYQLAVKGGLSPDQTLAVMRSMPIKICDDYSFYVSHQGYASGMNLSGVMILALWSRNEIADSSLIPLDAPVWTIRPPEDGSAWRYGYAPLVPAGDHELGHKFFGPGWEH